MCESFNYNGLGGILSEWLKERGCPPTSFDEESGEIFFDVEDADGNLREASMAIYAPGEYRPHPYPDSTWVVSVGPLGPRSFTEVFSMEDPSSLDALEQFLLGMPCDPRWQEMDR